MQSLKRYVGAQQDGRSKAAFLFEQSGQEMLDINLLVGVAD